MLLGSSLLVDAKQVNWGNLARVLNVLRGCWKSSSFVWMELNEFPVLSGVVLKGWSREAEAALSRFSEERNLSEVLVRIEKRGQRWTRRRGGYTIPVSEARGLVDDLAEDDMLALLLEPASPYADFYSLTSVCDLLTGSIEVEVVGPGFDASDVLRSDLTPHERFVVEQATESGRLGKRPEVRRSYITGPGVYRMSVQKRLEKIAARLRNPSFPEHELSHIKSEQLVGEALDYLKKSKQDLLVKNLSEYTPIPHELLGIFIAQVIRLLRAATDANVKWKELSIGGSFLNPSRLVIWDFFSPGDYETHLLASMKAAPPSN